MPALVPVILEPSFVTGAGDGVCAITDWGDLYCWGDRSAQGAPEVHTPTPVDTLPDSVLAVTLGGQHICARTPADEHFCWGENLYGQRGVAQATAAPNRLEGVDGAGRLVAGWSHTCVLGANGAVECWGDNTTGALGNGQAFQPRPTLTAPNY